VHLFWITSQGLEPFSSKLALPVPTDNGDRIEGQFERGQNQKCIHRNRNKFKKDCPKSFE
jgi:hypothetical protein